MAKINEDAIIIKVSELLRDDQPEAVILDAEVVEQLQVVIQELVGANRLVEVIKN